MREEIESGLRNAVERGDSLDDAVNSFINAGYNPVEVREAAKNVSTGAVSVVPSNNTSQSNMFDEKKPFAKTPPIDNMDQIGNKIGSNQKIVPENKENPQISPKVDLQKVAPKKMSTKTIILIALTILIVLLLFFLIGIVVFKDALLEMLSS